MGVSPNCRIMGFWGIRMNSVIDVSGSMPTRRAAFEGLLSSGYDTIKFCRDQVNPATIRTPVKSVSSLLIQEDWIHGRVRVLSLTPGSGLPTCLHSIDINQLRSKIPKELIRSHPTIKSLSGLVSRLTGNAGFAGCRSFQAIPYSPEADGREHVLIFGVIDGDIFVWKWNPWMVSADDEGEVIEFLTCGPGDLDDYMELKLCQFESDDDGGYQEDLVLVSMKGSIYTWNGANWSCLVVSDGLANDCRIVRVDHENLIVVVLCEAIISAFLIQPNNNITELCSITTKSSVKLGGCLWSLPGILTVACGRTMYQFELATEPSLGLVERARLEIGADYTHWSTYKDELLSAGGIMAGVNGDEAEFFMVKKGCLESIMKCPIGLCGLMDVMMEPSMELVVTTAGGLFSFPALMQRHCWQDTVTTPAGKASFDFSTWFDLLGQPFPYDQSACLQRVGQRAKMSGSLFFDLLCADQVLTAKKLHPPSNWSDLGELATLAGSIGPLPYLYLMLDSGQAEGRIRSFCCRYGVDGHDQSLVKAYWNFDSNQPGKGLFHLSQCMARKGDVKWTDKLALILPPALLITAQRLGFLPDGPALILQAYLESSQQWKQSISFARQQNCMQECFQAILLSRHWRRLAEIPLRPDEERILFALDPKPIPAERYASVLVLYAVLRGKHCLAVSLYDEWKGRVPADASSIWAGIKDIIANIGSVRQLFLPQPSDLEDVEDEISMTPAEPQPTTLRQFSVPSSPKPVLLDLDRPKTPILTKETVEPDAKPSLPAIPSSSLESDLTKVPQTPPSSAQKAKSIAGRPSPATSTGTVKSPGSSSPPLRSVLPRHVPANQPSRLANLVDESSDGDLMTQQHLLEPSLFNADILDEIASYAGSSSDEEEESEGGRAELADDQIRYVLAQASSRSSSSSAESVGLAESVESEKPDTSESPASRDRRKSYNLRNLPPVDYSLTPSKRNKPVSSSRSTTPSPTKPSPSVGLTDPTSSTATPKKRSPKPAETRSQFKRRLMTDLALPSPIAKRSRQPATATDQTASKPATPSRKQKGTPKKQQSPGPSDTPPIRATPPAALRRGRR